MFLIETISFCWAVGPFVYFIDDTTENDYRDNGLLVILNSCSTIHQVEYNINILVEILIPLALTFYSCFSITKSFYVLDYAAFWVLSSKIQKKVWTDIELCLGIISNAVFAQPHRNEVKEATKFYIFLSSFNFICCFHQLSRYCESQLNIQNTKI